MIPINCTINLLQVLSKIMNEPIFSELPLVKAVQDSLIDKGYRVASPIQEQAIPLLIEGRDLLACAQTGTGKTAAFALPVLNQFAKHPKKPFRRGVRCLVLTPTRELTVQVHESFKTYGKYLKLSTGMVFGGVSEKPQIKTLYQGLDILVATTGRLLDLQKRNHLDLSQVETFILDEADRMLDMGFLPDVRTIERLLPKRRQTVLFSATMAKEVTRLANQWLQNPREIRVAPQGTTADKVDQYVRFIDRSDKQTALIKILQERSNAHRNERSLVFSRTKHGAKNLAKKLNSFNIDTDSLHGNKSQSARQKTLNRYKSGKIPVLVATDVAARGIDVKNITLVINYDLPMEPDAYVHRIGRTARAGNTGKALAFCTKEEISLLKDIERLIRTKVTIETDHPFHAESIATLHRSGQPIAKPKSGRRGTSQGKTSQSKRNKRFPLRSTHQSSRRFLKERAVSN